MIWVALVTIVVSGIIGFCQDAAWKRARRCHHSVYGDCSKCHQEAGERALAAAAARAEAEAIRLQELDDAFFAIDEATRMKIIDTLEDHWAYADLPDWNADQMKQTVVKVYRRSLRNEGKPMEVSGHSVKRRGG